MLKKFTLPLIVTLSIVQLFVAMFMIYFGYSVEENVQKYGKEYKIPISVSSVIDGRVYFSPKDSYSWREIYQNKYAVLGVDENGNAYCKESSKQRPDDADYISPTKRNQNRLHEYKVDYDKDIASYNAGLFERDAHIVIRVHKGNFEVINLYIEDMLVADWIEKFETGEIPEIDHNSIIGNSENVWEDK